MFEAKANSVSEAYGTQSDYVAAAEQVVINSVDWAAVQEECRYLGTFEVPWAQWNAIPAHPNQRVTSRHAAQLVVSRVLDKPLDIHRVVAAVVVGAVSDSARLAQAAGASILSANNVVKVDGHSRTLAQSSGRAPVPETVVVHLYAAADELASAALYQAFDSSVSVKKNADKGQSALRSAGIEPSSSLFQNGAVILKALRLAAAIRDEGTVHVKTVNASKPVPGVEPTLDEAMAALVPGLALAKRFRKELIFLDGLAIAGKVMPCNADAIGAYIAILAKDFDGAAEFLTSLRAGKGLMEDGTGDALYMASQAVKMASDKRRRLRGVDRTAAIVATIVNTFSGFKAGESYDASRPPAQMAGIVALFESERKEAAKAN
jgi:hypothetical protein